MDASERIRAARVALVGIVCAAGIAACDTLLGANFDVHLRPHVDAGAGGRADAEGPDDPGTGGASTRPDPAGPTTPIPSASSPGPSFPRMDSGPAHHADAASPVPATRDATSPDSAMPDMPDAAPGRDASARDETVIGVFTNHPVVVAHDAAARSALADLSATGVHVIMPWADFLYTGDDSCDRVTGQCSAPPLCDAASCSVCPDPDHCYLRPASNDVCRQLGYDELECWLRGALDWWTGDNPAAPMSVLLTIAIHGGGTGDFRVGPTHIASLQKTQADLDDPRVFAAFRSFYDRLATILADPVYVPFVKDITVSLGDQVNEYLCDDAAWTAYGDFFRAARAYILDETRRPSMPIRVGASTSYMGLTCDGLWSFASDTETPAAQQIRALDAASDVVLFKYFPLDVPNGGLALDPRRAATDIAHMSDFRLSLPVPRGAARPPLLLAEVGYPTHPDLHDKSERDDRYSHFGAAYSTPEAAQRVFLESLFAALDGRSDFSGFYWWTLFDIDDATCYYYAASSLGLATPLSLASALCTSGLATSIGAPTREAWNVFRTRY